MLKVKKWVASAIAAFLMAAGMTFANALWAGSSDSESKLAVRDFTVENMTCATCPITVKKAMSRVDGVEEIAIDFETKIARVSYDPMRAKPQNIVDASTGVGFPATIVAEPQE